MRPLSQSSKENSSNRTAARVWRQCDGQTPVADLATRLQEELGLPASEALVGLALAQLRQAHLLQGAVARPETGVSRRAVIRKLGLAGGLAAMVPLVLSLNAPAAATVAVSRVQCGGTLCQPGEKCCDCSDFQEPDMCAASTASCDDVCD